MFSNKPSTLPDTNSYGLPKVPPGQLYTEKFPVMTYGPTPIISRDDWRLKVNGLVSSEQEMTFADLLTLPQTTIRADFHCVTHWSRFDDEWTGVMFRDFMEHLGDNVDPEAAFVMQHATGGYTTNLPLSVMVNEDVIIAHTFNGTELDSDHGGPVRIFTPKRYGWKGAKWLNRLEFMQEDRPGFWEQNGYSNSADPWNEERYWD